jgi:hypothetical protein
VNQKENNGEDEQQVNERRCHMEHDESSDPGEEQKKCEYKEQKSHSIAPLAILARFVDRFRPGSYVQSPQELSSHNCVFEVPFVKQN